MEDHKAAMELQLQQLEKKIEKQKFQYLRYSDLHDGVLKDNVGAFTFFATAEANDDFLDMLNMQQHDGDIGVLSRLRRYSRAKRAERLEKSVEELSQLDAEHSDIVFDNEHDGDSPFKHPSGRT